MPFKKGHIKTGGRQVGTTNKYKYVPLADQFQELDYDPVKQFVSLITGSTITDEAKIDKIIAIMKFLHPALESTSVHIDHAGDVAQNQELADLEAEFRTLMERKPRMEPWNGQTLLSQPSQESSPLESSMAPLDPTLPSSHETSSD